MKISLLGAPGCGKGTQAKLISEYYGIPHISTGDLFRKAIADNTPLGLEIKKYMDKLVPDEITIKLLKSRLDSPDCAKGYVLDGFPRNIPQADKFLEVEDLDCVIYFDLDDVQLLDRVRDRRTCSECGSIYSVKSHAGETCDVCGGKLIVREEDKKYENRLETYKTVTYPLVEYFKNKGLLKTIDTNKYAKYDIETSINKVFTEIRELLGDVND